MSLQASVISSRSVSNSQCIIKDDDDDAHCHPRHTFEVTNFVTVSDMLPCEKTMNEPPLTSHTETFLKVSNLSDLAQVTMRKICESYFLMPITFG